MNGERRRYGFVARSKLAAPSAFWPAPKIELLTCWICRGRGCLTVIRKYREAQEPCANCAGRGSLVTDNG